MAAVEKNTEFLKTQLEQLDSRLTISHNDSYIDFEPKISRFLAECSYDPEEDDPNDPINKLCGEEYKIYYDNILLFSFYPFQLGYGYHGNFYEGGIPNTTYLGLSQEFINQIDNIISIYMIFNLYYWRDQYSPEEFQYEIHKYKKMWCL